MDRMTSSEFRRRYATLDKPTAVTALGRVIGYWRPVGDGYMSVEEFKVRLSADEVQREVAARPFRPAPKPSAKGK